MNQHTKKLMERYPQLKSVAMEIDSAIDRLAECYQNGGKLLLCGNGGSASDCSHIVGELMKGFLKSRPTGSTDAVISRLQVGLPAISLTDQTALFTAFCNDVDPDLVFAQQVYALGKPGDILLGISTSGNSSNVLYAMHTAKVCGMTTISLTGAGGGKLKSQSDICIAVPEKGYLAQEAHLPIYHCICAAVEDALFTE